MAIIHSRLNTKTIDEVMNSFYDGKYDLLLSTSIVESGLDLPNANTLIVFNANMFGLSQLHQLRGRVGRSSRRAYAYFVISSKLLSTQAERRLQVIQMHDSLGAGFNISSHDLDIRGAGNLLGDEQSGKISEIGVELYQKLLKEAVNHSRGIEPTIEDLSPVINLKAPVLIPENYVSDLSLRLDLYRQLGSLENDKALDEYVMELKDRFGIIPNELSNLIYVLRIKLICKKASIIRADVNPKGAIISFYKDYFPKPENLVSWIHKNRKIVKLRTDHKLVYMKKWDLINDQINGLKKLVEILYSLSS